MANIRIEKDKSSSVLPWILGLLLLGLAVWGVAELFEEGGEELVEEVYEEEDYVAPTAAAVDVDDTDYDGIYGEYYDYTADMEGEMGLDHEFSHRALTLLANAAAEVAEENEIEDVSADSKAARVRQLADDITKDPYATDHADKIRMSALLITEILEDVDGQVFNGSNAATLTTLREEAQSINSETLTLNQKEDVRSFFRAARAVLDGMQ